MDGRRINLGSRVYCLTCSPYGERTKNRREGETKRCPACEADLPLDAFYTRRGKDLSSWCMGCHRKEGADRHRRFKEQCVSYKGGSCLRCGYNRCIAAMEFHHKDPLQKDFNLSRVKSHAWSSTIEAELDKCDLLCSNCHREAHVDLDLS